MAYPTEHVAPHALGAVGLFFFAVGALGLGYLSVIWVLMHVVPLLPVQPIGGRPLLAYSIAAALLGGQAMSLGLLAELIVAYTGNTNDSYSVAERVSSNGHDQVPTEAATTT